MSVPSVYVTHWLVLRNSESVLKMTGLQPSDVTSALILMVRTMAEILRVQHHCASSLSVVNLSFILLYLA